MVETAFSINDDEPLAIQCTSPVRIDTHRLGTDGEVDRSTNGGMGDVGIFDPFERRERSILERADRHENSVREIEQLTS